MEETQTPVGGKKDKKKKGQITVPANKKGRHIMGMLNFLLHYCNSRILALSAFSFLWKA